MSILAIRAALESALAGMSPALSTAFENASFTPMTGTPYQRVWLQLATPDDGEIAGTSFTEVGYLQVNLCYPINAGPADAAARAELLRSTFRKASTFSASGQVVMITRTPVILPSLIDEDRYVLPVRIPLRAEVAA